MSFALEILLYALCDVLYYGVIFLLLLFVRKTQGKLAEVINCLLPASKLLMILCLGAAFFFFGIPSGSYERIVPFVFAILGLLLPYVVNRALLHWFEINSAVDLIWAAVFAASAFFFSSFGCEGTPMIVALQITLPAAAVTSALCAVLEKCKQKKGR